MMMLVEITLMGIMVGIIMVVIIMEQPLKGVLMKLQ